MTETPGAGEWLRGNGRDADIAICTRVRLARNIEGYHFAPTMDQDEARRLNADVVAALTDLDVGAPLQVMDIGDLGNVERNMLVERHLISREHSDGDRARSVLLDDRESVSIMVNEEDHLRSQVFESGFELDRAQQRAEDLDHQLAERVPLAFSEEFGFLTSCPTNTGTGMRVSVMLHLPGLVWAKEIEKATGTAQKIHLAVRGLYGEGSRALGDFYQVSNQVTLGRSEEEILRDVDKAVARLIDWEREVRSALLRGESRTRTLDKIYRALGTLERARILSSQEALNCLSAVRLGVHQEVLTGIDIGEINQALLRCQPAHLQRDRQRELSPSERDQERADLIRGILP